MRFSVPYRIRSEAERVRARHPGLGAVPIALAAVLFTFAATVFAGQGFVYIPGGVLERRGDRVCVEPFEILDHPLTNLEYARFTGTTGYRHPLHWRNGKIPQGLEQHPVIFVNRADVAAYMAWRSELEGRIYRLPNAAEFEFAARGGESGARYPWGDGDPAGRANFDNNEGRRFDRWSDYLEAARSGPPNGYGLYGMAGNVWQMTVSLHDPATQRWKYRIEDPAALENGIMGGSWARGAEYLRCGVQLNLSPGTRHPDAGFRPVREPADADWRIQNRRLVAIAREGKKVLLSWAMRDGDAPETGFNVYRAFSRDTAGKRLNREPVRDRCTYLDSTLTTARRVHYYLRSVDGRGNEGRRCEWAGVTPSDHGTAEVARFIPVAKPGGLVPIFGDLNGDGALDCVVRLSNGNHEMSQDPGVPVQLEAFTSYGRSLWRVDLCWHDHCYGSANNVPFNVWDMDGDGRDDIVTRMQIKDRVYLAILNGMTGEVEAKTPWPAMVSDFQKSSTRIHLSVAYLDGVRPAAVTQTGLYENELFVAYDAALQPLWRFESFAETSGSGGHKIEIADVDGDGRHEVFNGTTCLNSDGSMRWSIFRGHPDIVSIHDYLPERPGLEVFYIVESSVHAGVYMVDANTGEIIWKLNREDDPRWTHGHRGWSADIWSGSPGLECVSNRAGHDDHHLLLFAADGRLLLDPFPDGFTPVEWDGDGTRELLSEGGRRVSNFSGSDLLPIENAVPNPVPRSRLLYVADLCGDFRDELVLQIETGNGPALSLVTAVEPLTGRAIPVWDKLDYRLWLARNMGGGYPSVYDSPRIALDP